VVVHLLVKSFSVHTEQQASMRSFDHQFFEARFVLEEFLYDIFTVCLKETLSRKMLVGHRLRRPKDCFSIVFDLVVAPEVINCSRCSLFAQESVKFVLRNTHVCVNKVC